MGRGPAAIVQVDRSGSKKSLDPGRGGGTDHGLAIDTILVGGGVQGGWYGQVPDLAPAARHADALVPTVDFRWVYATVLNHLGGMPA